MGNSVNSFLRGILLGQQQLAQFENIKGQRQQRELAASQEQRASAEEQRRQKLFPYQEHQAQMEQEIGGLQKDLLTAQVGSAQESLKRTKALGDIFNDPQKFNDFINGSVGQLGELDPDEKAVVMAGVSKDRLNKDVTFAGTSAAIDKIYQGRLSKSKEGSLNEKIIESQIGPRPVPPKTKDPAALQQYQAQQAAWGQKAQQILAKIQSDPAIARAWAFNYYRPQKVWDAKNQTFRIATAGEAEQNPDLKPLSASDVKMMSGLGASFAELNTSANNFIKNIPSVSKLKGVIDPAIVSAYLESGDEGIARTIVTGKAFASLPKDVQNMLFSLRIARQASFTIRGIVSSVSANSDKRADLIISELPSAVDIVSGDPDLVRRKMEAWQRNIQAIMHQYGGLINAAGIEVPEPALGGATSETDNSEEARKARLRAKHGGQP